MLRVYSAHQRKKPTLNVVDTNDFLKVQHQSRDINNRSRDWQLRDQRVLLLKNGKGPTLL